MRRAYFDALVALVAALMVWIGVVRWRDALPERPPTAAIVGPAPDSRGDRRLPSAEDARVTIERNPFRLGRVPGDVRFARAGAPTAGGPVAAPPIARPTLVLRGIVGGPPWTAIIDGLPGHGPGTLAREGSTFDKLVVRTVTAGSAVVQGPDTTWRLTLGGTDQR
jgi:hypothetical protein